MRAALLLLVAAVPAAGCGRPRYAHASVDRTAFARDTAVARGYLVPAPDPPVVKLTDVPPGSTLVLSCSDFDRGISFEAMVTAAGGGFESLVRAPGRAGGADREEAAFLATLLDVDVSKITASHGGEAYRKRFSELERAVSGDPGAGLAALAGQEGPLFPSDAAKLLSDIMQHGRATAAVLGGVVDLIERRAEAKPGLREWLNWGGGGRLVEMVLQQPACSPALAMRIVQGALSGSIRGDRELLLLGALRREGLSAADLRAVARGILTAGASSSERRRVLREAVAHPASDAELLAECVRDVKRVEFSADRRDVLLAVLATTASRPTLPEEFLRRIARESAGALDYDDDLEAVLTAVVRHPGATAAVRSDVREAARAIRSDAVRARVEAQSRAQ